MKIMIPVDDDRRSVCVSFARAPYWLVHDSDTDATEVLENPAADAEGGAGPMADANFCRRSFSIYTRQRFLRETRIIANTMRVAESRCVREQNFVVSNKINGL